MSFVSKNIASEYLSSVLKSVHGACGYDAGYMTNRFGNAPISMSGYRSNVLRKNAVPPLID